MITDEIAAISTDPSTPNSDLAPVLATAPLFRNLSSEQLRRAQSLLRYKTLPAGKDIITMGLPGEAAYLILRGTVKLHAEQANGVDVILGILGPGEIFGEISLIDGSVRSASAVTISDVTVAWFDRSALWECLRTMPEVALNLTRTLARRIRMSDLHIQALASLDAHGRIARQILSFAREYGQPDGSSIRITVPLTQSDLAGLAGISRARVNQVMTDYKRLNYLSVDQSHYITVTDPRGLAGHCR